MRISLARSMAIAACFCAFTTGATAGTVVDAILSELHAQGYVDIDVSRTLLGRTQIEARSPRVTREIIIDPRTGEILRDYWSPVIADDDIAGDVSLTDPAGGKIDGPGTGSGSSGGAGSSGSGSGGAGNGGSESRDDGDDGGDDKDGGGDSGHGNSGGEGED